MTAAAGCADATNPGSQSTTTTSRVGGLSALRASGGVTLNTKITNNSLEVDPNAIKAGKVSFNLINDGDAKRDVIILATERASALLKSGLSSSETAATPRSGLIPAGGALTLKLALKPGHYALISTDPDHKQVITYTTLTVR